MSEQHELQVKRTTENLLDPDNMNQKATPGAEIIKVPTSSALPRAQAEAQIILDKATRRVAELATFRKKKILPSRRLSKNATQQNSFFMRSRRMQRGRKLSDRIEREKRTNLTILVVVSLKFVQTLDALVSMKYNQHY